MGLNTYPKDTTKNLVVSKPRFSYGGKNKVFTTAKNATENLSIDLHQLINLIKSKPPNELHTVRKICKAGFDGGLSSRSIKTKIKPFKNQLPFVLLSGVCPKHHNNIDLEYNCFVQIDIDFKFAGGDVRSIEIKSKVQSFPFVVFAAISPSGFGVKVLVATTNMDKDLHKKVSKALIYNLSEKLQIDKVFFDNLGASQPCFVPFDSDPYFNPNYQKFDAFRALFELERMERMELEKQLAKARQSPIIAESDDFTVPNIKVLEYLTNQIVLSGINITDGYNEWFAVACAYGSEGEAARGLFHSVASLHPDYDFNKNERKFNEGIKNGSNIGYLVNRCKDHNIFINDFCKDYIKTFGPKKQTSNGGNLIINPGKNSPTINHKFILGENEYASHVLNDFDFGIGLYQIKGGTGVGKTKFVSEKFTKIVVVSRNVTTLENYKQYGFSQFLYSDVKNDFSELQANGKERITVTFKSFKKLKSTINLSGYVIVFDECHLMNEYFFEVRNDTRYSYNSIKELSSTNTVIVMSANDFYYNVPNVNYKKQIELKKPSVQRTVNVVYNASFENLKETIYKRLGEGKKVLLYNNRTEEKYINQLIKTEFSANNSITFFDSEKHGQIDLGTLTSQITVTTSALVTGKDIDNENIGCITYVMDQNIDRSVLNQFPGRARKYESASFDLLFEFNPNNENYGRYCFSDLRNWCYTMACNTIAASVNNWSLLRENKLYFVTKDKDGTLVVDWFEIDCFIKKMISKHTIMNTELLTNFLQSHGFDPTIQILEDTPEEKEEKQTTKTKKEVYMEELDLIQDHKENEIDFLTNSWNRVRGLEKCGFSRKDAIHYSNVFHSTMNWKRFVNLLVVESSLRTNDKNFIRLYNMIFDKLDDYYSTIEILGILGEMKLKKTDLITDLGQIVGTAKNIDYRDKKRVRDMIKDLKNYYLFDVKKRDAGKVFKVLKSGFLNGLNPIISDVANLKKYNRK